MTSVTITGSGTPIPSATRAGPGVLVRSGNLTLQFDAGRSTVQRLAGCGVWPNALDAVFVTHHHSDHLTGMQDLVLTRWTVLGEGVALLPIVAPSGPSVSFLKRMLDAWDADIAARSEHTGRLSAPGYQVAPFEVPDSGTELVDVWSSGETLVRAGRVRHGGVEPSVGYRIEAPDGTIAITGDTIVCDEVATLANGADVVVYEAMRFDAIRQLPATAHFLMDYHADTRLIGAQMASLDAGTVILTHLIPAPDTDEQRQRYVDDLRSGGYLGEVIVADDLTTIEIAR